MDRINGAGHVGRRFVAEDADLGRPPTLITDAWLNSVQEEIVNVILAAGGTLDGVQEDQLLKAINTLTQKASAVSAAASGTVDAITANFTPAIAALSDHLLLIVRAGGANTSTTPTFTPASATIAAKTIVKGHNQPLVAGDISGAGFRAELQYDATLDKWVLLNPATGVSATQTITAVGDPTFANNSTSAASTGWVRGAMSAIATAAGFAVSLATNGYIKFPSWLGGLIVQWGTTASIGSSTSSGTITFPVAFPTECVYLNFIGTTAASAGSNTNPSISTKTATNFSFVNSYLNAAAFNWLSFGF